MKNIYLNINEKYFYISMKIFLHIKGEFFLHINEKL